MSRADALIFGKSLLPPHEYSARPRDVLEGSFLSARLNISLLFHGAIKSHFVGAALWVTELECPVRVHRSAEVRPISKVGCRLDDPFHASASVRLQLKLAVCETFHRPQSTRGSGLPLPSDGTAGAIE